LAATAWVNEKLAWERSTPPVACERDSLSTTLLPSVATSGATFREKVMPTGWPAGIRPMSFGESRTVTFVEGVTPSALNTARLAITPEYSSTSELFTIATE
jgi:hypothetical protein